ncbi:MAG: hypothetical protein QM723_08025 [Myxococcaceae bacterium]
MKTIFLAAVLTAAVALAGGRHGGGGGGVNVQGNFGPWRVQTQVNPTYLNPYAGSPYAARSPYAINPYYGAYWYSMPYTLDEMPAVNKPRERPAPVEPVIFEAPSKPEVVVVQQPAPEPAPAPQVVIVQQPVPVAAPAPVAQPEPAPPAAPAAAVEKPRTPGPEVYMWVDEDNVTHYSTNVPDQYKAKAKKLTSLRE